MLSIQENLRTTPDLCILLEPSSKTGVHSTRVPALRKGCLAGVRYRTDGGGNRIEALKRPRISRHHDPVSRSL
jgi:hypothetical protein